MPHVGGSSPGRATGRHRRRWSSPDSSGCSLDRSGARGWRRPWRARRLSRDGPVQQRPLATNRSGFHGAGLSRVERGHNGSMPVVSCASCKQPLTGVLREVPMPPAGEKAERHRVSSPRMRQGTYSISPKTRVIVFNPNDLTGTAPHPEPGRRHGCCGLDGLDGPNLVCEGCGADVATQQSDCWTDHLVAAEARRRDRHHRNSELNLCHRSTGLAHPCRNTTGSGRTSRD